MGQVYPYSPITRGEVPQTQDFLTAKSMVLYALEKEVERGAVYGAKVFGSVAKGTPSRRSDFDLLIITPDYPPLCYFEDILKRIRHDTNVRIEPQLVQQTLAKLGFHSIDSTFHAHIQGIPSEGNVVGNDPLTVLRPSDKTVLQVQKDYLIEKLRKLPGGVFTDSIEDELRVLQRSLEAPINVGRRVLQVLTPDGDPSILPNDDKSTVAQVFREVYQDTPLQPNFDFLLQQDAVYTELLEDALRGQVSEAEYNAQVDDMKRACIPAAYEWVTDIILHQASLLEGNPLTAEGRGYRSSGKET